MPRSDTALADPSSTNGAPEHWWVPGHKRPQGRTVSFPELVHVHALWRDALEARDGHLEDLDRQYRGARAAFEQDNGKIVAEYWCRRVPSAVALTANGPTLTFHRASDWATRDAPEIAALVHRCDDLAARAIQVLTGVRERICLQLVMSSASHLLSLVDAREDPHEQDPERHRLETKAAIEEEQR